MLQGEKNQQDALSWKSRSISFRKFATKSRACLRKGMCKDKVSYRFLPPCIHKFNASYCIFNTLPIPLVLLLPMLPMSQVWPPENHDVGHSSLAATRSQDPSCIHTAFVERKSTLWRPVTYVTVLCSHTCDMQQEQPSEQQKRSLTQPLVYERARWGQGGAPTWMMCKMFINNRKS